MDYHKVRAEFEPENVKLVLIGESPPAPNKKGESKYFYDPNGSTRESLFEATMKALGIDLGDDKAKGLHEFKQRGVLLLDMSYTPVNKLSKGERNEAIERGYDQLVERLSELPAGVPVAIVVQSVYERFLYRLRKASFNVIDRKIPFPSHQKERINEFCAELKSIAAKYNI
jgi:uracil DNA glycosylase